MKRFLVIVGLFTIPVVWMTVLYGGSHSKLLIYVLAGGLAAVSALLGRALIGLEKERIAAEHQGQVRDR